MESLFAGRSHQRQPTRLGESWTTSEGSVIVLNFVNAIIAVLFVDILSTVRGINTWHRLWQLARALSSSRKTSRGLSFQGHWGIASFHGPIWSRVFHGHRCGCGCTADGCGNSKSLRIDEVARFEDPQGWSCWSRCISHISVVVGSFQLTLPSLSAWGGSISSLC